MFISSTHQVFNKSKNNSWSRIGGGYDREEQDSTVDRMGFPTSLDGSGDVRNFLNDHQQRKELEDLLTRVDEKNVCELWFPFTVFLP